MIKKLSRVLSLFVALALVAVAGLPAAAYGAPVAGAPAAQLAAASVNLSKDAEGYYLVSSQSDLEQMRNSLTGKYKLNADIALTGTWTPIGKTSGASAFSGTFVNGGDYTISGVNVNGGSYAGLFGYLKGATIDGINVVVNTVKPGANYGGALAGAAKDSTIRNVSINGGYVEAYSYAGGLLGVAYGTTSIENCFVRDVTVKTRASYAGGFAGALYEKATVNLSGVENTDVDAVHYSGGFAGTIYGTTQTTNSYASGGTVTVKYYAGGGFASEIMVSAVVTGCYAQVDVIKGGSTTDASIGGFSGLIYGKATVNNCYATGSVKTTTSGSSSYQVGGFVGHLAGSVKLANCYSTGSILFTNKANRVGAFAGYVYSQASMSNCYYDTTTANYSDGVGSGSASGLRGLSTSDMITAGSFGGWAIQNNADGAAAGAGSQWYIDEGASYPYFSYQYNGHSAERVNYNLATVTYQDDTGLDQFLADFTVQGATPLKVTSGGAARAYFPYAGTSLYGLSTEAPVNVPASGFPSASRYSLGGVSATGIIGFGTGTAPEPEPTFYDVTFYWNINNTEDVYLVESVEENDTVDFPEYPERPYYYMAGWFTEPECLNEYDFDAPVTGDLHLYAQWRPLPDSV